MAMKKLAIELNFSFEEKIFGISSIYESFLGKIMSRLVEPFNLLEGSYNGRYYIIFDYFPFFSDLFYIYTRTVVDEMELRNGTYINGFFYQDLDTKKIKQILNEERVELVKFQGKERINGLAKVSEFVNDQLKSMLVYSKFKLENREIKLQKIFKIIRYLIDGYRKSLRGDIKRINNSWSGDIDTNKETLRIKNILMKKSENIDEETIKSVLEKHSLLCKEDIF